MVTWKRPPNRPLAECRIAFVANSLTISSAVSTSGQPLRNMVTKRRASVIETVDPRKEREMHQADTGHSWVSRGLYAAAHPAYEQHRGKLKVLDV